eukprot:31309-Pelagococcus_subviridis.AAC.5
MNYQSGRHRWVEYENIENYDYSASSIPREWHGWLHHVDDEPGLSARTAPAYEVKFIPGGDTTGVPDKIAGLRIGSGTRRGRRRDTTRPTTNVVGPEPRDDNERTSRRASSSQPDACRRRRLPEKSLRNGVHIANGVVWEAVSPPPPPPPSSSLSSSSSSSSSTSSTSSSSFLKTPRRTRPRAWTPRRSSRPSLAGTPPPGAPRPGRTDRSTRGRRRRRSEGRSCMFIGQLKGDAIECRNRAMGETHVCRERTGGTNGAACVRCASDTQSTLLSHGCNFTSFTPPFRQPNR